MNVNKHMKTALLFLAEDLTGRRQMRKIGDPFPLIYTKKNQKGA